MISSNVATQGAVSQQAMSVTLILTAAISRTNLIAVNAISFISMVTSVKIVVQFRLFLHKFMSIHPHVTANLIFHYCCIASFLMKSYLLHNSFPDSHLRLH